jgi:hypothetical protein
MKKTLFLLCALLGTIGAWAETINLGNSASFKNNANTTFYKNGVVQSAGVWCDKATQGYVILTGSISSSDGKIEVVKYGATSLTISVPSVMTITSYSFGLQIAQNGSNTCSVNGIDLNESSATTISASNLNTSSVTINFTGTGDNYGECRLEFSDFTIEVSGTFVSDASQLSNTKAYVVTTARGTWTLNTANTVFSSTKKNDNGTYIDYDQADMTSEAQEFAIYKSGDFYYLYSLKAGKFIAFTLSNQGASLYDYATVPYTVSTSDYSPYPLRISTFDSRYYANNNGAGGIAINGFTTEDDGNRLAIAEARDLTTEEITAINNALEASPLLNKHKAFTVTANRGTWCSNAGGTSLATTTSNSSYATDYDKFALMFLSNKFYLYNLGTKKFIKKDGSLNADGGDEVSVRYSGDTNRPYMFFFPDGPVYFNMQEGGSSYAMNNYSTPDPGNKQSVTQADAVYIGEMLTKFESVNNITDGNYHITTTIDGTKYYVTSAGKLSTCVADGTTFTITKTTGGDFGSGIRIDSGSERFTNPTLSNNHANLSQNFYAHGTGDRDGYERQVFFLNDEGKFAIRSCNVASAASSWGDAGRTFWTYNVGEAELTPCYSYDPAYVWELEAPGTTRNVTFNFYYGGSKVHEVSATMEVGAAAAIPSASAYDFCSYTYSPATITSTSVTSVDVTVGWTGPFELSADYATAHWYDMAMRRNWYVTSADKDESGALLTVKANAMGLAEDDYQWAFVGDPYHIQLYNKAEGSSKVFNATGVETNQGIPTFSAGPYYWKIVRSTTSIPDAFLLNAPNTNCSINQFGGEGGSLKFWNSTNNLGDEGSAFTVFDVPNDFHEFAAAEIQPYATTTGYFALKDAVKSTIGWQDSYATTCPFADYKEMKLKLQAIDLTDMSNYVLPETGYYLLKNKNYGTYMGIDPSDANMYGNYTTATAAKQIVKLTKTGDGTYSIGLMGKFAPATVSQSAQVTANATAGTYTVVIPTVGYAAFQADPSAQYSALHCASGGSIVGWETVAAASQWEAIDATSINFEIGIGGDGWATAYLPFPYTTPEGVTAYTGTVNGSALSLTEVSGTVPASTAVVIKGTGGTTPTFTIAAEADAITGNALLGSYDPVTVADGDNIYALAKKGDSVGFYPVGDGVVIPVGKAYLVYTASNPVKGFTFEFGEDDPTGISLMEDGRSQMEDGAIYNLAGQRINKIQKGINIVNGKKVLK